MANSFQPLFEPGRIGSLELRNRIVMAPMGSNFGEKDGTCGERIQAYYEARAQGGAGLLIMGVCSVAFPNGTAEPFQVGVSHDDFIPGLAQVARRVHRHGAKIAMQLQHAGKAAVRDLADGREMWVPSLPPHIKTDMLQSLTDEEMATFVRGANRPAPRYRMMDKDDIGQMTEYFASAAARAQKAGFDGVELHAGHSYILAGFLSPYYNRRDDEYGGPLENRARLLLETIRAVKTRTGNDFPLWIRLDGEELRTPGGITLADATRTAQLAVDAGADAISVSAYATITTGTAFTEAPLPQAPDAFVDYARAVRKAVKVPVIVSGRIEPETAARCIAKGEFDFVAMARKLLADPELPNKLRQNRPQDVRPCIYCYVCVSQIFINQRVKCAANPLTGHEFETSIERAPAARRVLVVGGGPAGMEAARVAALRGHHVTLVERGDRLGGTLFFAGLAYPENGLLLDHLASQIRESAVDVRLATAVTPELVAQLEPDAIVVATGARRAAPAIPGADQKHVWSGDELRRLMTNDGATEIARAKLSLTERALFVAGGMVKATDSAKALQALSKLWMPLGKRVVIIGGGLVGLELAEFLEARGREVTILEPGEKAGRELSIVRRWRVLAAVGDRCTLHRQATVLEITQNTVVWRDAEGETLHTRCDSVVLAIGAEADDTMARMLAPGGVPIHSIGDCHEVAHIEGAIRQGNQIGRTV